MRLALLRNMEEFYSKAHNKKNKTVYTYNPILKWFFIFINHFFMIYRRKYTHEYTIKQSKEFSIDIFVLFNRWTEIVVF